MDNIKKTRILFSSLFSRKMPYAIFQKNKKEIIFTNISVDDALIYEPNSTQYIHKVTVKDEEYMKWLTGLIKYSKDYDVILDTRMFMNIINKTKKGNRIEFGTVCIDLVMYTDDVSVQCGRLLDKSVSSIYETIFHQLDKYGQWEIVKDLTEKQYHPKEFNMVEVQVGDLIYKGIMELGKNVVSINELGRRMKDEYKLQLAIIKTNQSVFLKYIFENHVLYVESLCPALFYLKSYLPKE